MFAYFTIALLLLASGIFAMEKEAKIALKDLPAAVQKSVQDFAKGAKLLGVSKEEETGKTVYRVETIRIGSSKDALIDAEGQILAIEDPIALNKVPGQAKAAIEKAATMEGKIMKVTAVVRDGVTSYRALIKKDGTKSEILVAAEGKVIK
jgi:hypothetical protein